MYATITSGVRKALSVVVLLAVLQDSSAQQTAPKKDTVAVTKLQVTGTIRDATIFLPLIWPMKARRSIG